MWNQLRNMFSRRRPELSDEARAFITKLAASNIWILAIGLNGIPDIPQGNSSAALEALEPHLKPLAEVGDDDSVFPFNYGEGTTQVMPFFSSEERARHYLGDTGLGVDISLFQPYCLIAEFVALPAQDDVELIFDPRTPFERRITRDERLLLRRLTATAS
jgi:hypothetical protein